MYFKHSLKLKNDLFNNEPLLYNQLYIVIPWHKYTFAYCSTCIY